MYLLGWATWIPVLITINSNVAQLTFVNGASMYPTLNPEYQQTLRRDLCLDYRLRAQEGLCRGMIVTFKCVAPGKSSYRPAALSILNSSR